MGAERGEWNIDRGVMTRPYRSEDAAATLEVFVDAIQITASRDYSLEQVAAWARPTERNLREWDDGMIRRDSIVATVDGEVAGFSDVSATGYIDMMFVSPRFARRGVASELMSRVEGRARESGVRRLWADVSVTALPFFEAKGFIVEAEQHPITAGIRMTNYRMSRKL